jgi:hypothetical protein
MHTYSQASILTHYIVTTTRSHYSSLSSFHALLALLLPDFTYVVVRSYSILTHSLAHFNSTRSLILISSSLSAHILVVISLYISSEAIFSRRCSIIDDVT